jgi:hypothetical protein
MIKLKLKHWRAAGLAAGLSLVAACGGEAGEAGEAGEGGEGGEAGEAGASAPAPSAATATAPAGGEAGEAGAASAYAGLSGNQLTALRLQHLRGFVMIANAVAAEGQPAEAAVLVQQGLLEVYDSAPDQFGSLNVELVRGAADASLSQAQLTARLRAADTEIQRAEAALDVDEAALTARLIDIATGLYQSVNQADYVDPIEYQHSLGAALAAQSALSAGAGELRGENARAFTEAQNEVQRFVALWREPIAPEQPATYAQVLAQGSRVRLALSPFL